MRFVGSTHKDVTEMQEEKRILRKVTGEAVVSWDYPASMCYTFRCTVKQCEIVGDELVYFVAVCDEEDDTLLW